MRIVILGCAGSGKTTLAKRLGDATGTPVICLDAIWQTVERRTPSSAPERSEAASNSQTENFTLEEFRRVIHQAHSAENWISDGNFAQATFDLRLPQATQIIWLDRNRIFCMKNAVTRLFKRNESHRVRRLVKVLKFIWNFDAVNHPRIEKLRATFGPNAPLSVLRNDQEVGDFLARTRSSFVLTEQNSPRH